MNKLDKAMTKMNCWDVLNVLEGRVRRKLNDRLHDVLKPTYFDSIPLDTIKGVLREFDVVMLQEDNTEWTGFITGREGRMSVDLADASYSFGPGESYVPFRNTMFVMTWHKMPSGRYEVIAYVS